MADEPLAKGPKRVLLLGQGPDGHPPATHEYLPGLRMLAKCLGRVPNLQTVVVAADGAWPDGPELLDGADAAVVYLAEGAKWVSADERRLAAFRKLAERGGGLAVIHWGMGTKDAKPIDNFVQLFGACHGGPDRKYQVVSLEPRIVNDRHPVTTAVTFPAGMPFQEEYYYRLKTSPSATRFTPLVSATIDGEPNMVGWAWERPDGGRSFGFSGCHFHKNWELEAYRQLVTQGIVWSVRLPIPDGGLKVDIEPGDLTLEKKAKG
jgi:type 1 glutamine amidotransferase